MAELSPIRRVSFEGTVIGPEDWTPEGAWVIDWNDERIHLLGTAVQVDVLPCGICAMCKRGHPEVCDRLCYCEDANHCCMIAGHHHHVIPHRGCILR